MVCINKVSNSFPHRNIEFTKFHWCCRCIANLLQKHAMIEWKNTFVHSIHWIGMLLIYLEFESKIVHWFSHSMFLIFLCCLFCISLASLYSITMLVFNAEFRIESCIRNTEFILHIASIFENHCRNWIHWFELPEIRKLCVLYHNTVTNEILSDCLIALTASFRIAFHETKRANFFDWCLKIFYFREKGKLDSLHNNYKPQPRSIDIYGYSMVL